MVRSPSEIVEELGTDLHALYADDTEASALYRVKIVLPDMNTGERTEGKTKIIKGFLTQDISVVGQAEWGTPFAHSPASRGMVDELVSGLTVAYNVVKGTMAQRRLQSKLQTVVTWSSSETPVFSFPLLLLALNKDDDVRVAASDLLKGTFPIETSLITLKAPFGYSPAGMAKSTHKLDKVGTMNTDAKAFDGTVAIFVGKWLQLFNMVIRQVTVTFSKEVIPSGFPLYARVELMVLPAMMWTADDVDALFPKLVGPLGEGGYGKSAEVGY